MAIVTPRIINRPPSVVNSWERTFRPKVLQVVHVTGNRKVILNHDDGIEPGQTAFQEWDFAESHKEGPSAHDYVARNGDAIEMLDPRTRVAWSNGDFDKPNLKLPGVKYLNELRSRGKNANRGCYREIELVGHPSGFPPTDEQLETCAWWLARDSIDTGLPIVRGETVLTHADINGVDRPNCAFPAAVREDRLKHLVERANAIKSAMQGAVPPPPPPEGDPMLKFAVTGAGGGTVRVLTSNLWRIADGINQETTPERPFDVLATITLEAPLPGFEDAPGDFRTGFLVAGGPPAGVPYLVLAKDASFTAPAPLAASGGCNDAVNAVIDQIRDALPLVLEAARPK
jgi:hypothetical protein